MDAILKELGLQELTDLFTENDITPSVIVNLEESEFLSLGINTIGDRVRLREKCRDFLEDKNDHESPVVKRLKDFMKSRNTHVKRSLNQNNRKMKHTRKVIIGWKHHERKMTFRLVPPSKGGGKQEIDINRDLSLEETTELFARSYFPNGRNEASGLSLENLTFFVATFTGQEIGNIVNAGQTFGELVDEIGTSPLRLYLHTKEKKSTIKEEAKCIQEANGDNELSENALHIPSVTNDLVLARPVRRKRTLRRAALHCNNTIAAVTQRPSHAMTVVDAVSSEEDRETRTSTEVEQFCLGLNKVCGLWDLIKSDPLPWLDVFCCVKMVTRSFFLEEVEILYSPEGSNRRTKEEETVYAWEVFLKDVEDKVVALSFQELLAFITGASEIPTVGFESQLVMEFYDIEGNETRLPFTSTCTLTFCLPHGCSCELLNILFVRAVKESQGFHKI